MGTCYLDVEDEITGAIARIRGITDEHAILVLPAGSRIATSRINFRLLAREGSERGLELLVVSDEPGARALAISAGLPAYDSVAAAEAALTQFRQQDGKLSERTGQGQSRRRSPPEGTLLMPVPASGSEGSARASRTPPDETQVAREADGDQRARWQGRTAAGHRPSAETAPLPAMATAAGAAARTRPLPQDELAARDRTDRRSQVGGRRIRLAPLLALGLVLLILAGAVYGAYVLLPTATISLRPHVEQIGPIEMTVVADPSVAVPDPADAVIPAQRLDVPLSVSGTFPVTGSEVSQSRATGTVRFRSENTLFEVPIAAGTRVSTEAGVAFETTEAVTLEAASFATGPTTAQVEVRAVRAGPRGNVDADTITQVPDSLAAALVSVRNPRPTTGGRRQEQAVIAEEDYDGALETLVRRLPAELRRTLADPATTPRGLTLYPASAQLGEPVPDQAVADLVATPAEEFTLTVSASATVLSVNEGLVDDIVAERMSAEVPTGASVHPDGVVTERSNGELVGDTITYSATASMATYRLPDRDTLLEQVRGVSVSEAEAIMSRYGSVEVSVWPEFVDRMPDQLSRINLTILSPVESP